MSYVEEFEKRRGYFNILDWVVIIACCVGMAGCVGMIEGGLFGVWTYIYVGGIIVAASIFVIVVVYIIEEYVLW